MADTDSRNRNRKKTSQGTNFRPRRSKYGAPPRQARGTPEQRQRRLDAAEVNSAMPPLETAAPKADEPQLVSGTPANSTYDASQDQNPLVEQGDNVTGNTGSMTAAQLREQEMQAIGRPKDEEAESTEEQTKLKEAGGNADSTADKTDDSDESDEENDLNYSGDGDAKPKKRRFRGRLNRKSGTAGGIVLLISVLAIILSGIISGPLQLLQFGSLISLKNFSNLTEFSNDRSARRMYYLLRGHGERSKLGFINNKLADRFEIKLNNSGLSSTYTPAGRFLGFEVIDEKKAASILNDLAKDGINTIERDGSRFVDLGNVDFRQRRSTIRAFVKGAKIDGIAQKLGSRLLIKRAGVDFHPIKNTKKRAAERLVQYLEDRKRERTERNKNGTDLEDFTPRADEGTDTDNDGDIDEPPSPEADQAARAADDLIGDADIDVSSPRATSALRQRLLTSLSGAAAFVGAACTLRGLGNDAEKLQYTQTILPMIRTGMMYVSIASQIQAGQDVNLDELGALQAELYDESNDGDPSTHPSSVFSAQVFQSMRHETPLSGPDIDSALKPSKLGEKPLFFRLIDDIPRIDDACDVNDFIGNIPVIKQIGELTSYALASVLPIEQFVSGLVSWLAGQGMNYAATGSQLGYIAMYGGRLAANNQAAASGGVELTGTESAELDDYNRDSINYDFRQKSMMAKLFDIHDYRSVTAQVAINMPRSASAALTALISSPFKAFSFLTPHASAQETPYDYGFNEMGFTVAERNDPSIADPYTVAEEVEPNLDELNDRFGGENCGFNMTVELEGERVKIINGDESYNPNTDENKEKIEECYASDDPMLLKYRAYLADAIGTNAEACWEGIDETTCDDMGFGDVVARGSTAPAPVASPIVAPGLNGYTIPCAGISTQSRVTGALPDTINWSGIRDSGTIGTNSARPTGQPMKVYIRDACPGATDIKTVVIGSSIHATENYGQGVSFELLFRKDLPDNVRIVAIPEINGSHIGSSFVGRVNSNGVNLNRNFDYRWGTMSGDELDPSSTNWRGLTPNSEPETRAVESFLQALAGINLLIVYHDNLNYVGAANNTDPALASAYQSIVNGAGLGLGLGNDGGPRIYQSGSMDGWFNATTNIPALLVEMPPSVSESGLSTHANAVINLVTSGRL